MNKNYRFFFSYKSGKNMGFFGKQQKNVNLKLSVLKKQCSFNRVKQNKIINPKNVNTTFSRRWVLSNPNLVGDAEAVLKWCSYLGTPGAAPPDQEEDPGSGSILGLRIRMKGA